MEYNDFLELIYESKKKLEEIKKQPIILKSLFYSLSVSNEGIKYYIKNKKIEENFDSICIRGGIGNQNLIPFYLNTYWEDEEVTLEKWLKE